MKSKQGQTQRLNEASPRPPLAEAVARCLDHAAFTAALRDIYARVDRAIARRKAPCRACGRCCRFDQLDHRLYVSPGELALLLLERPKRPIRPGRCPYQRGRLCTARGRRTLGCRAFFCNERMTDFSHELYEKWHTRIRRLHEKHRLPYLYAELTVALNECL
ncbi:MAG TPA: hypothetical protein VM098_08155 [Phycisphaerae bacterium]|nr:hypothetical protein [Phycisphaerae bacterium]